MTKSDLFMMEDGCFAYRNVRDDLKLRTECNRLWKYYRDSAEPQTPKDFANHFQSIFWEMYLFDILRSRCLRRTSGPDFLVDEHVFLEATVASPGGENGNTLDNVSVLLPTDSQSAETSYLAPFDQVILRITNSLNQKADSKKNTNNIFTLGSSQPVVIAINLPYRQANHCLIGSGGLGLRAFFGIAKDQFYISEDGVFNPYLTNRPAVKKANSKLIETTAFLKKENSHISAVLLGSVNILSTSYKNPQFELIHNPHALHPIPKGWFGKGDEFWVDKKGLHHKVNSV